jgi:hypothetical protein
MVARSTTRTGSVPRTDETAWWLLRACGVLAAIALVGTPGAAVADEGGVSVWLPGIFGSLAAAPQQPGMSFTTMYYRTAVEATGSVAAAREITVGRFNPTVTARLDATLDARADLGLFLPTYVFATPVLGGQASMGVLTVFGRSTASVDAALTATLGPFSAKRFYSATDSATGFGDLFPQALLRWNQGVHNFMIYGMSGIPIGDYDSRRLANLGTNHWSVDGGAGYTYFDPQAGNELSVVTGITYNFENPTTDYQSGVDWHLDWGLSKFLSKQLHIGVAGYAYRQLSADRGQAPVLGDFNSRVFGIGPQIGYIIPLGTLQGYLNVKAYKEFEAENRPEGWNAWVTFSISPAAAIPPSGRSRSVHK